MLLALAATSHPTKSSATMRRVIVKAVSSEIYTGAQDSTHTSFRSHLPYRGNGVRTDNVEAFGYRAQRREARIRVINFDY